MKKFIIALLIALSIPAIASTELTKENINEQLGKAVAAKKVIVVKFYADWCSPCQAMKPIYEQAEKDFAGKVVFFTVNIDKEKELSEKITGIPTILILNIKKGGKGTGLRGAHPLKELEDAIREVL